MKVICFRFNGGITEALYAVNIDLYVIEGSCTAWMLKGRKSCRDRGFGGYNAYNHINIGEFRDEVGESL